MLPGLQKIRIVQLTVGECIVSNLLTVDLQAENLSYRFITIYRPPLSNSDGLEDSLRLRKTIDSLVSSSPGPVYILGDLNCGGIDWTFTTNPSNQVERTIGDAFRNNGFVQCVQVATRGTNLLDVVCTNEPLTLCRVEVAPPFAMSDHNCVVFDILLSSGIGANNKTCPEYTRYLWSKADYNFMADYVSRIKWDELFTVNFTADDMWHAFQSVLDEAIAKRRYPRHIRKLFGQKLAIWRRLKAEQNNAGLRSAYNKTAAQCRLAVLNFEIYMYVENKVIADNNVGSFYKFVNSKMTVRSGIGTLVSNNGLLVSDDKSKADPLKH